MEQFQILTEIMEKISTKVDALPTKEYVDAKIDESRRHTEILIENTITKRIDSLFDGYKLTHEKQYELERRMEKLEAIIADLQSRIA